MFVSERVRSVRSRRVESDRVAGFVTVCVCVRVRRITHTFIPLEMFKSVDVESGGKKIVEIVKSIQDTRAVPSVCGPLLHSLTEAIKL